MKALSVQQPFADWIASGKKTIETRSRKTRYRGPLLIVSCKYPRFEDRLCGYALVIVKLIDCRLMCVDDKEEACVEFQPGLWAWVFDDRVEVIKPFPVKGKLGIYEVDYDDDTGNPDSRDPVHGVEV